MRRRVTALLVAAAAASCGGSGSTSDLEIEVQFGTPAGEVTTNSLHYWVLEPGPVAEGETAPGCAALVGDEIDPYALAFARLADFVVLADDGPGGVAAEQPRRALLVYAEAVDHRGRTHLAGCAALTPAADVEPVTIALRAPGTYDCADPATEEDASCDDGMYCTVGETCAGGACAGGGPLDCTYVADQCNAESCTEELGCVAAPLSDGFGCEDGAYCTVGDTCQDGLCVTGTARDCSSADGVCRTGTCNEGGNSCVPVIDPDLDCTDNLYCTLNDMCTGGGTCTGTPRNCSAAADACNSAACTEGSLGNCVRTPINGGLACTTNCTVGGTCAAGVCTGGTPQTPGTEGPMTDVTCTDFLDNDCDGDFDAADTDCQ